MLSREQIDTLFAFCDRHHVKYYDVQVELVDHLANAIEAEMASNPSVSFDSALASVYARFGVRGFAPIVNARTETLKRRYNSERRKIFWSYFTWPRIGGTACLLAFILFVARFIPYDDLVYASRAAWIFVVGFEAYVIIRIRVLIRKQTRTLLLTHVAHISSWLGGVFGGFLMPVYFGDHTYNKLSEAGGRWMFTLQILVGAIFFLTSLAHRNLGDKTLLKAREDFGELFEYE